MVKKKKRELYEILAKHKAKKEKVQEKGVEPSPAKAKTIILKRIAVVVIFLGCIGGIFFLGKILFEKYKEKQEPISINKDGKEEPKDRKPISPPPTSKPRFTVRVKAGRADRAEHFDKYISILKKNGFDAFKSKSRSGRYVFLLVGRCRTKEDAEKLREKIKNFKIGKKRPFHDAFVDNIDKHIK